jgi:hypothetical protein
MPGGQKISRAQEKAIAALLSEASLESAAARAGVSERTLKYWLKQPAFAAAYRAARQQVVEHAITLLQRTASLAVATLHRNLSCGKAATEVSAAGKILEHALGAVEQFDLAQRVAELEERLARQGAMHADLDPQTNGEATGGPGR